MKAYSGLAHCYGNPIATLDFETSGERPGYHEILQIAVVPLNSDFEPHPEMRPFYTNVAPLYPERAELGATQRHGLNLDELILTAPTLEKVTDLFLEWFRTLDLPVGKSLIPLAHNWSFESMWLMQWLGPDLKRELFHSHGRDPMECGIMLNDRAAYAGEQIPFQRVGLKNMAEVFNIVNERPHDALCDCLTAARVYRELLRMEVH
jgi:DNA polymerase III epsilon subunit-like protein